MTRSRSDDAPATRRDVRAIKDEIVGELPLDVSVEVDRLRVEVRDLSEQLERAVDFFLDVYEWWRGETPEREQMRRAVEAERLDRFARSFLEQREPDGTGPTQSHLAEALGVSDRWLRIVGWDRIQARAAELAEETGTTN